MTKTTIAQQIDSILQKRQPTVAKITQSQQSVQSLLDSFSEMETLKEIFVKNQANTDENTEIWQSLDFSFISKKLETAQADLERLKERFNRKTLRIGVAGQSGQGKSQLLQSLTGLTAQEIPTSSGGFTTGARSLIFHHDSPETYATVHFYSEHEFLHEIIAPYYVKLKESTPLMLGEIPTTVEQFSKVVLPATDNDASGGLMVALLTLVWRIKLLKISIIRQILL